MALITQAQIQAGLKAGLDAVTGFNSAAQIEGDDLLDYSVELLPYAMILTAQSYSLKPAMGRVVGTYTIPVILFFEFVDWQETRNAVRNLETAVIEYFHANGAMWAANGLSGVMLTGIDAQDIGAVYRTDAGQDSLPVYLTRTIDFQLELI